MSYRTLLVHVDGTSEGGARLRNAVALARRLKAALIGLGAIAFDPMPDPIGASQHALKEHIDDTLRQAEDLFREATASLEAASFRSRVDFPAHAVADIACGADLIVGSRHGEPAAPQLFAVPDDLIMTVGGPVLLQPTAAQPLEARHVIVGWKSTPETRRALSDALPFLKAAETVQVLRFSDQADDASQEALALIAERLRRHGVRAEAELRPKAAGSVTEDLIAAADTAGADLIVAGGYGKPRVREMVLGGVTRGLLAHATQYVLFSH